MRHRNPPRADKYWYQSFTKWGALVVAVGKGMSDPTNPENWIEALGIAMVLFGARDAIGRAVK
jgi:hypothetical protein